MSHVFVVDTNKQPLNPVHPGRARLLLKAGKAAVFKRYPFTLILKTAVESPQIKPLRIKVDPGSRTTGIAIVNDQSGAVVFAAELTHRGKEIKKRLDDRRAVRRSRRVRHTRYRKPRFQNRVRRAGWLAPSLESRVWNVTTWVKRVMRLCPLSAISMELVCFDLQKMENSTIEGCEYQQGTLAGYEIREYVLHKWSHRCAYCGKQNIPLQVAPVTDAATVNTTRWALFEQLKGIGLPVECGSGGLTKFNRSTRNLAKSHWCDAACVGKSTPETLQVQGIIPLHITATGYGNRQMCGTDERGFTTRHRQRKKVHHGFQTGDLARAVVPQGTHRGVHVGRVLTRASGSFDLKTAHRRIGGIHARYCQPIHRNDGYSYQSARGDHSSPA